MSSHTRTRDAQMRAALAGPSAWRYRMWSGGVRVQWLTGSAAGHSRKRALPGWRWPQSQLSPRPTPPSLWWHPTRTSSSFASTRVTKASGPQRQGSGEPSEMAFPGASKQAGTSALQLCIERWSHHEWWRAAGFQF